MEHDQSSYYCRGPDDFCWGTAPVGPTLVTGPWRGPNGGRDAEGDENQDAEEVHISIRQPGARFTKYLRTNFGKT